MNWSCRSAVVGVFTLAVSATATAVVLNQVVVEDGGDHDRIEVHVSAETGLNLFSLSAPDRLVADFKPMTLASGLRVLDGRGALIQRVRHGLQADGVLRLVFDLNRQVTVDVRFEKVASGGIYRIALMSADPSVLPTYVESPPAQVVPSDARPNAATPANRLPAVTHEVSISEPSDPSTHDAERRAEAEASARALITRQLETLDRTQSARSQTGTANPSPEAAVPSPAWRAPLAPPWE